MFSFPPAFFFGYYAHILFFPLDYWKHIQLSICLKIEKFPIQIILKQLIIIINNITDLNCQYIL